MFQRVIMQTALASCSKWLKIFILFPSLLLLFVNCDQEGFCDNMAGAACLSAFDYQVFGRVQRVFFRKVTLSPLTN